MKIKELDFKTAFKYPFNRPKGMLNILWWLVPVVGWFAIIGYVIRIVQNFTNGKFKKLPILKFKSDLKLGFFMFIKAIPFAVAVMIIISFATKINILAGILTNFFMSLFIIPILVINFFNKQDIKSLFEFEILNSVFDNLGDYLMAILKRFLLSIIFLLMWIILVGIPAAALWQNTKNILEKRQG